MQVYFLNTLPERGYPFYIYYVRTDGKYYGWDGQNNRFYNLSTPNIDDLVGLSFENLQEGDVLSYDSVSQTWINKVINTSTGVNSFNERQGDVYLLSSDVTDALGYTPEDLTNKQNDLTPSPIKYPTVDAVNTGLSGKQDSLGYTPENVLNKQNNLTSSTTNYPTVDAVNAGLLTKEPAITSGTSSEYWRGDKTFQTLDKNAIGLNNVDNTSDADKPISTLQATAIGLKEDSSNKSTSTTDSASTTKFPVWSAIVSYFDISRIKTILGITTLSGSNTGDQDLSGLVTKTTTINSQALSSNINLTTSDITDSTNKRYVTDSQLSVIGNTSGINTGDQDLSGLVVKNTAIVGATKTKITYDTKGLVTSGEDATTADIADTLNKRYITDAQLTVISNTSGTNTGDNATNSQYSGLAASKQDVLGFTPENLANKSTNVNTDQTSDTKYPSVKSVYDWATIVFTTTSAVATQITTALVGYATQSWVNSQGFITSVIGSLGYTPENEANKQADLTPSTTNYPTINAVNTGLEAKENIITEGTTLQYFRGDKTFQTLDKLVVGLENVDNTSDTDKPVSIATQMSLDLKQNSLGFTAENVSNKENTTIDTSTTKYPTVNLLKTGLDTKQNIAPSVQSVVSSATVTPVFGNDLVVITAQAAGLTLANPTGSWVQGKDLLIRIKDNGTARAITYGAKYRAIGVTLPTTTVISKTTYLGIIYNSTDDTFDVIGVTTQA